MSVREDPVEDRVVERVSDHGGLALKAEHLFPGFPDRIVIARFPIFGLIETKSPLGRLKPAQIICHEILGRLGWKVHVPRNAADVEAALQAIFGERYVAP